MGTGAEDMSTTQKTARWYMIDKDGMATLCTDREDAEKEAKDANMAWPHTAPHRAVQLVEVGTSARGLIDAAQAVIDRWDTPLWKDAPATAGYIAALREALEADRAMRAAQPAGAQQPGAAYAELPSYEHQRAIMEAERNASLDEYSRIVPLTSTESMIYERAFTNGWNRHASHGQAPAQAQAAPAAVEGPVEWRELAARVMDALADAQEQTNSAYPAHASRYPAWEAHLRWLRWHADMFRTGKPVGSGAGQPAVLAALAAAPASVLEDAERLDWLESNSQINIERVRYLGATKSIYEVTPYDSISYDGETLRAAIDAARGIGIKNGDSNGLKT